jgi:uncharacterized protein (TIGR00290 family)
MKVLLSWSSGKDAAWALHSLQSSHPGAVQGLLTTVNEAFDRVAMHGVRRSVLGAQARAAGLPLHCVHLPWPCSNDEYERRMAAAVASFVEAGYTHVAFGDLFLEDVRRYREEQLAGSGLEPLFPLWQMDTRALATSMVEGGLRAIIATVDPRALDPAMAGRAFDAAFLKDLPATVDPCGERGEFHSCVWDGPMFAEPLEVVTGEVVTRDGFVFADVRLCSE